MKKMLGKEQKYTCGKPTWATTSLYQNYIRFSSQGRAVSSIKWCDDVVIQMQRFSIFTFDDTIIWSMWHNNKEKCIILMVVWPWRFSFYMFFDLLEESIWIDIPSVELCISFLCIPTDFYTSHIHYYKNESLWYWYLISTTNWTYKVFVEIFQMESFTVLSLSPQT